MQFRGPAENGTYAYGCRFLDLKYFYEFIDTYYIFVTEIQFNNLLASHLLFLPQCGFFHESFW